MTTDNLEKFNVAQTLEYMATRTPFRRAIVFPVGNDPIGRSKFIQLSFQQLNEECDRYAHGLIQFGIHQGERVLLLMTPGIELIAVSFALVKLGAVPIFIDPGMGRKAFLQCVTDTEPTVFIGIPKAHIFRCLYPQPFKTIKHIITVGKHWFWGGITLDQVRANPYKPFPAAPTTRESEAAITFTSGSTGMPKGVVYLHGMFGALIELMRDDIGISEGEIDLPGLYIFALLNPALGVTTIIPGMDPTKPAKVNAANIVDAIQTHGVTTSFGSPTIWKRVGQYCIENNIQLPSVKRILMAGAPVPPSLISQFSHILSTGEVNTPFGATEALPITTMSGCEILADTAKLSEQGRGVCIGRATQGNKIYIIQITDNPIPVWDDALLVPQGEIGEIVVKGPVVTRVYINRPVQTALAKIHDKDGIWHRMGDLGYFDEMGRLWFCGRKSHRVETRHGLMLPVQCEAIFNHHPDVARSALVGVGKLGEQYPILIVEPKPNKMPTTPQARKRFITDLLALGDKYEHTRVIQEILFHPSLPVDIRHNAKIQREKLALWAEKRLKSKHLG